MKLNTIPYNLEAEISVLAIIMNKNDLILDVSEEINENYFYDIRNQYIYRKIFDIYVKDVKMDLVTIVEYICKKDTGFNIDISYITDIYTSFCTSTSLKTHLNILREKYLRRSIIKICKEAINLAEGDTEPSEVIENLEKALNLEDMERKSIISDQELMHKTIGAIEYNCEHLDGISGMQSGYKNLDTLLNGFNKGELVIIGGRPGQGKTYLSLNVAEEIGKKNKVAIFEMEMTAERIGFRRLSRLSRIHHGRLSRGILKDEQWEVLMDNANILSKRNNIFTDTSSNISIYDIKNRCKKLKLKHGLDMIIIDHLTLLRLDTSNNRYDLKVAEVTRMCKSMAKELDICVVLLSQLSRECERRVDKRPILSDLREAGSIEQDADVVLFVYRDDYYYKDSEIKNIMEVIIAKNRDGRTGTIEFKFKPQFQLLEEN